MTGNFNLKACSGLRYNPIYLDPFLFVGILYLDYNRLLSSDKIAALYIYVVIQRMILYFSFMRSVITQLCDHLDIPFLKTKQAYLASK
jgi:hypothetical protein